MNLLDFNHFLFAGAAFVVGVLLTGVGALVLWRWRMPRRDLASELAVKDDETLQLKRKLDEADRHRQQETNDLREAVEQLGRQCDEATDQCAKLTSNVETARQEQHLFKRKAYTVVVSYKKALAVQTDHVKEIEALQGRIWERPAADGVPSFVPLAQRKAVIFAVTNLKGGVGKTSLAANLAAIYMGRGRRTLAVDLDHQASLTHLCLPLERIQEISRGEGKFVDNVLQAKSAFAQAALNNLTPLGEDGSCLLAARDELADVEEHAKARWLTQPGTPDVRYLLRAALHDPLIQDRFDVILLDCPPRWTPASINALAACDFVIVPVLLDRTSAEAVPRLLAWLQSLKTKNICAELAILGVVGNRAFRKQQLTSREKGVWGDLQKQCADAWKAPVYHFERFLPASPRFADAAEDRVFAAHDKSLYPIFEELVEEIEHQRANDESRRVAAVS